MPMACPWTRGRLKKKPGNSYIRVPRPLVVHSKTCTLKTRNVQQSSLNATSTFDMFLSLMLSSCCIYCCVGVDGLALLVRHVEPTATMAQSSVRNLERQKQWRCSFQLVAALRIYRSKLVDWPYRETGLLLLRQWEFSPLLVVVCRIWAGSAHGVSCIEPLYHLRSCCEAAHVQHVHFLISIW